MSFFHGILMQDDLEGQRAYDTGNDRSADDRGLGYHEVTRIRKGQRGDEQGNREADTAEDTSSQDIAEVRPIRHIHDMEFNESKGTHENADWLAEAEAEQDAEANR